MGKINTVSGLNKVNLGYIPQVQNEAPKEAAEPDIGGAVVERPMARSVIHKLDVLLLGAAEKSIASNAAQNVRTVGDVLVGKGVLTEKKAAKLNALAADASAKLKALDKFTGAELAKALMPDKSNDKLLTWRKGFFSMNPVAKAVKAAIEAQQNLSLALGEFNMRLAENDSVQGSLKQAFFELQLQADRRATEINSIVLKMYDLALADAASGGNSSQEDKLLLSATFHELAPREAILMHGTADAIKLMSEKFGAAMAPLAEKLDAFASDGGRVLSSEEIAQLDRDMITMRNALKDVRQNGIEVKGGRLEVDKSLLAAMEGLLKGVEGKIAGAKTLAAKKSLETFINDVMQNISPDATPEGKAVCDRLGLSNSMFTDYQIAKNEFIALLRKAADGKISMDKFDSQAKLAILRLESVAPGSDFFKEIGFDAGTAKRVDAGVDGLKLMTAQFKELMRRAEMVKNGGSEGLLTMGDVRRIFVGDMSLSSAVEAAVRGFKPTDVDGAADDANIVQSRAFGSGNAGSTYLVTTKNGQEYVFKPELEGRIGLGHLSLAQGVAYTDLQTTAQLNLATQDVAKMIGCDDVIVKYSVGNHNGQFGIFMEKATGASGGDCANRRNVTSGNALAPSDVAKNITDPRARGVARGQLAKKLNKLQWLDIITGQEDRHWGNYFVNIDKDTHEVTVKGIDNDASFGANRIGVQKRILSVEQAKKFETALADVCHSLHGDLGSTELSNRVKNDPGIVRNPDGTCTVDIAKAKSPEVAMALQAVIGVQSLALPETIDSEVYDRLMELDSNPEKKEAYLKSIAPRLSPEALEAARLRLEDAIAHAKQLADDGMVMKDEQWNDSLVLQNMHTSMKRGVSIRRSDNTVVVVGTENPYVNQHTVEECPSYYYRDYLGGMFRG